jgi:hypothetical protein
VPQHGVASDGSLYTITDSGNEWTATAAAGKGRKPELLVEGAGHTAAYTRCVKHNAAKAVTA